MSYIVSYYFSKNNETMAGFGCIKYEEYLGYDFLAIDIIKETGNDNVVILNIIEEPLLDTIQIKKTTYNWLNLRAKILNALEDNGVDNWEGYDQAMESV